MEHINIERLKPFLDKDIVTIGLAQIIYPAMGRDIYVDEIQRLTKQIDSGETIALKNDTYINALAYTDIMFRKTNKYLYIFSGSNSDGFITTLLDSFTEALKRIKDNHGEVRVISLGSHIRKKTKTFYANFKARYREIFDYKLAKVKNSEELKHFYIADNKHVRIEKSHPELNEDTPVDLIKATVDFNNVRKSKNVKQYFDVIWNKIKQ